MKHTKKIFAFLLFLIVFYSCSTRKDTFINRNYHALNTKFNILYNGGLAFDEGLKDIREKHKDNYWERLLIEPITFDETEIALPKFTPKSTTGSEEEQPKDLSYFELAEEKAVKAVQKHSMNIKDRERNSQIDNAYLLLGKSRYYTQRFVPALEAFNYVIANYPDANLINETKVWRAKTNIRLENEKLAIESLTFLLDEEEELTDDIRERAHTAMAMAYSKTDTIQKVVEHLKLATRTHENKEQTARNMFVLGQIYSELNSKDSARAVFKKLADFKKMPYKYRIHSNIELVKNTSTDSSSTALINRFKKLIKNRDNRPYLDELYYHVGVLEENQDSLQDAISYYQKSLKAKNAGDYQKTYTYERIGNIHFKNADFVLASSYYDSVLQVATEAVSNEKRIRKVKRRHKALASLQKYESVLQTNDSILRIANLPEAGQKEFFENYITVLKQKDEELAQQQLNAISFGNSFGGGSLASVDNRGKWYFYSTQSKGFGEAEFERIWGTRPLEDNWRWSDKTSITNASTDSITSTVSQSRYNLDAYLETIPKDKIVLDSLTSSRNDALYQLGLIYKEQFKNPKLAIQNLERLEDVNTDEKLNLPIAYHLYQIYTEQENVAKANQYKDVILTKYPDTQYAQVIQFPNKKLVQEETVSAIEEAYKKAYYLYKENKFDEVVLNVNNLLPTLQESDLLPKFELLKAYAIGKTKDKESYKLAMEFVALSYANTEEGKKAKEIVKQLE